MSEMDKARQLWQALDEVSGHSEPFPTEVVEVALSIDAAYMDCVKRGETFYASDECAYCGQYSGYGNWWCGSCPGGEE